MTAGEPDSRTIGVRVLAILGPLAGQSGVVTAVQPPQWRRVRWDGGGSDWYRADSLIPETQALANVRVIP